MKNSPKEGLNRHLLFNALSKGGLFLVLFLLLTQCGKAFGYGRLIHSEINRMAVETLPEEMKSSFSPYASYLATHASDPDIWKESNPAEAHKHWFHLDFYGSRGFENLPRDFATVKRSFSPAAISENGRLLWTIVQYTDSLRAAMQSGRWKEAMTYAAALGHYVADAHQPLHTTSNYDGQETGNDGIHLRFEVEMFRRHWEKNHTIGSKAHYVESSFAFALSFLVKVSEGKDLILEADNRAKLASGGRIDDGYYDSLWDQMRPSATRWVEQAAVDLGSLWYKAWVDAGKPPISSTKEILPDEGPRAADSRGRSRENLYVTLGLVVVAAVVVFLVFATRRQQQH